MNLKAFEKLINTQFLKQYNTHIVGGFDEPLYLPENGNRPAEIRYTRDYYRSALHELAHWCVAGKERRLQEDYDYWYVPDGRNQEQQNEFYQCEVKPQAIEWAFSLACGVKFDISVDNINQAVSGDPEFRKKVRSQLFSYLKEGFPARAQQLLELIVNYRMGGSNKIYGILEKQLENYD